MNERFVSVLTRNTLALILAGGRGSRLKQLTDWRAKPSVPFGGKFRIVDFCLSNCFNSGVRRVSVLTQYKAHSLIRHIQKGWGHFRGEFNEFVELLPAQQRLDEASWYQGTADAVFQNLDIIREHAPEFVLILAGDHVYKMDYGPMIAYHEKNQADLTVGCIEVDLKSAEAFGVMSVNDEHRITQFVEKPKSPQAIPDKPDQALASMGIYVFNTKFLYEQLNRDSQLKGSSHDFGKDMIPSIINKYRVFAYPFREDSGVQAYWRDVGTLDSYWQANLELIGVTPPLNLYDEKWPIWTYQEQLPPAKFVFDDDHRRGMAVDSMVSGGCIISGATVRRSLLFSNSKINTGAYLEDSVVLPNANIGRHCRIKRTVIDKGCIVPPNTIIGENLEEDAKRYYVSEGGVVLVTPDMLGQNIHHAR